MSVKTPQAVQACHELLHWIIPHIDDFPRKRRFTLGAKLETALLEVLELLLQAAYTRNKREALTQANLRLAVCRHLWRLSYELKNIDMRRYEHGAQLLDNIGRQIGGWLKGL